jgi:LysR family glycine cleavage system transcriptional activator
MESEALMEEYLVPVCSAEYLAKHAFLKEPKDLARCTLLHDGHAWSGAEEDAEWRHWLLEAGAVNVDSKQGQFFSLSNLSLEAALSHQGVALGRDSLTKELLEAGQLLTPIDRRIKSRMKYYMVYPRELSHRPGMQAVMGWLREQATASCRTR